MVGSQPRVACRVRPEISVNSRVRSASTRQLPNLASSSPAPKAANPCSPHSALSHARGGNLATPHPRTTAPVPLIQLPTPAAPALPGIFRSSTRTAPDAPPPEATTAQSSLLPPPPPPAATSPATTLH